MGHPTVLLASQSPRRKQLLQQIGINPICRPVNIDEKIIGDEDALVYCQRLAKHKAQTAWQQAKDKVVLGSDTIVVLAERILGKPINEQDAFDMLMSLSGKTHMVITSVAVINADKIKCIDSISMVTFSQLEESEVWEYIASQEPMDKAGSYGIQGYAAKWIQHISGSYSGIMGLPLYETNQLLKEFL